MHKILTLTLGGLLAVAGVGCNACHWCCKGASCQDDCQSCGYGNTMNYGGDPSVLPAPSGTTVVTPGPN